MKGGDVEMISRFLYIPKPEYKAKKDDTVTNENFVRMKFAKFEDIPKMAKEYDPKRFDDGQYNLYDCLTKAIIVQDGNEDHVAIIPKYVDRKWSPMKKKIFASASKFFTLFLLTCL